LNVEFFLLKLELHGCGNTTDVNIFK